MFKVIPEKCLGCGACIGACPVKAINIETGKAKINPELCICCGGCDFICPANAID